MLQVRSNESKYPLVLPLVMLARARETTIELKQVHPVNIWFPKLVTLSGIVIEVRLVHPPKPLLISDVNALDSTTEDRLLHPLNALL